MFVDIIIYKHYLIQHRNPYTSERIRHSAIVTADV